MTKYVKHHVRQQTLENLVSVFHQSFDEAVAVLDEHCKVDQQSNSLAWSPWVGGRGRVGDGEGREGMGRGEGGMGGGE